MPLLLSPESLTETLTSVCNATAADGGDLTVKEGGVRDAMLVTSEGHLVAHSGSLSLDQASLSAGVMASIWRSQKQLGEAAVNDGLDPGHLGTVVME